MRSGVAPDHPEVKSVTNDFEKVAAEPRFAFLGNVRVGADADVSLRQLRQSYHAVVLAYGAAGDRELGVPGEQLRNVLSARAFVNWYNAHPAFRDLDVDLARAAAPTAVIFGQGNVAVDCARALTKAPDELAATDMAAHAVEALRGSSFKRVLLVGRRGSAQAAFTMKELRELTKLDDVACVVDPENLQRGLTEASLLEIKEQRAKKRMNELLSKIAEGFGKSNAERAVEIKFLAAPVEILPDAKDPTRVGAVRVEKTRLEGEPNKQRAVGTGEFEEIPCGLVLRSIGYKSLPISDDLPFDSRRNVVANVQGRVVDPATNEAVKGLYCTGWVKRGPSGIIGTNIVDARETVSSLAEDLAAGKYLHADSDKSVGGLDDVKRAVLESNPTKQFVTWADFEKLNAEETKRGEGVGKPREKSTSVDEMLAIVAAN